MMRRVVIVTMALAGCGQQSGVDDLVGENHPANPNAIASELPAVSPTLAVVDSPQTLPATQPASPQHGGHHHDH